MYKYVEPMIVEADKKCCRAMLDKLCQSLREKGISAQPALVGSGRLNIVTQNEEEPYDLDYDLIIQKMTEEYRNDCKKLKDEVMNELNRIVQDTEFSFSKDSRSVITSIVKFPDGSGKRFSFDLAIVKKDNEGNTERLIHDKPNGNYIWNISRDYWAGADNKASRIRKNGKSQDLREEYLMLKNRYLTRNDNTHTSSAIYTEAVEHVYSRLFGKEK